MRALARLRSLYRNLVHRDRVERDLDDELGAVFAALEDEHRQSGLTAEDARRAAEQFAADSGSRVGGIRTASQGFFSFEGENSGMPEINQISKKARVVISADYYLVD